MVEESTEDGWFLRIYGNERELEQLDEFLDSPECRLVRLKETGEAYNLTACRFLNYAAASEVCESAKKLLIMIKAFAKIERGWDFQSVSIGLGKVVVENENSPLLVKREGSNLNVNAFEKGLIDSGEVNEVTVSGPGQNKQLPKRQKMLHDKYLNRCEDKIDGAVFDALYHFSENTSYYSLYKVFEIIKSVTDKNPQVDTKSKMISRGWVKNEDEVFAFKESANCYGAVKNPEGKYILRHSKEDCLEAVRQREGKKSRRKKYKGVIFELPEAEDFIRRLLIKWIASKRPRVS